MLDNKYLTIQYKAVKLRPNLNCKSFGIYAAVCTRCDSNYMGQTKIVLVIDGQPIELIGINQNLVQKISLMNVHYTDTIVLIIRKV